MDVKELLFPFAEVRKSQNAFLLEVDKAVKKRVPLLVHAPTGMGKTVSTLAPSLAFALKEKKTVFFLTSRHTQHRIALETLKIIKETYEIPIFVIDLIAKKHLCLFTDTSKSTNSDFIEYCKLVRERDECDYYINLKSKGATSNAAISAVKNLEHIQTVQEVMSNCKTHHVCPYEILHLGARKANVIICDYFHILNLNIRDNLLKKINKELSDCILILDEAHNLPERCRELLTASLSTITLERALGEAKNVEKIQGIIEDLRRTLERFAQEM